MSFIADLFSGKKKGTSVVLIDIGITSVAGAYARYAEGEPPALLYTRRFPIEVRADEPREEAMTRALITLGNTLVREGAPILARTTGSGNADAILVSIDAPWQETSIRTQMFEQRESFIFTKNLVAETLERTRVTTPGKTLADESIIGTILNGYESRDPYGKEVHRAAVIVLTSLIDAKVAESVAKTLQSIYHTTDILTIAGSSLRYQAMQKAFPHERDALILDATGPLTSIALIRKGLFVSITEVKVSDADTIGSWVGHIGDELAELAKHFPLPRTIFLLAREPEVSDLREALDSASLGELWLSDNPPKIISVLASHITGLVRQSAAATPDLLLLLIAIYYQARHEREL